MDLHAVLAVLGEASAKAAPQGFQIDVRPVMAGIVAEEHRRDIGAVGRTDGLFGQGLGQGAGRIVNIGSGLAAGGLTNSAALCASQGAVHQLTLALALEWARHNIRVSAIGAGWVTPDRTAEGHPQDALERYIPSRRKGHPEDLCGLLVYLCSDASDFVTGQTILVDGGWTAW